MEYWRNSRGEEDPLLSFLKKCLYVCVCVNELHMHVDALRGQKSVSIT